METFFDLKRADWKNIFKYSTIILMLIRSWYRKSEKMMNKKYTYLIYKQHEQTLTPVEAQQLNQWLESKPEHRAFATHLLSTLKESKLTQFPPFTDKRAVWLKIQQQTLAANPSKFSVFDWVQFHFPYAKSYALAAVFILISLFLGYGPLKTLFNPYRSVITLKGQRTTIGLDDGSSIIMNSESEIKIQSNYGKKHRIIQLKGEAFFKVMPGTSPFIVKTTAASCIVVGTAFNVWARENDTRVAVKEGVVRLKAETGKIDSVLVKANETSQVAGANSPSTPKPVNIDSSCGWTEGKLTFLRTPLPAVISELERFYNIQIQVTEQALLDKTITATIYQLTVDQAITSICETMQIDFKKENRTYSLFTRKTQ